MKCEVIFVKCVVIDDTSPEMIVINHFRKDYEFSISTPLLLGFEPNPSQVVAMIELASNKRANIKNVEFFVHACHKLVFPNYSKFKNYLLCYV